MTRIAISAKAFEAIARTISLGTVGYENEINGAGAERACNDDARCMALT